MASSQFKSEEVRSPRPAPFPFAWNSPVIPGSETVVTTLRSDSFPAIADPAEKTTVPEATRRLFPANPEADDSLGIQLGHFTIQRRIGVGGMASVFLAVDEQLRRSVALKVLSPSLTSDPAAVLRFQNEARAAARLDHDNIARIFNYGEDSGLHYIAYEYIPGSNLRDVIRSKDRLAPTEAVNYAMQLAAALSHTSAAGVIHRDIKPSNVLITPQGRAKLVDLGLARKESADSTSAELTVAGTTLGTFDYISPEQAKDPRSVDVRSDIYSLGCTLYHMLTGEPPYPEGTVLQKLLDHQGKEPPDPSRKNRRVPPELSAIVRKMMASDPKKRYSSPARLLSDLLKVARILGAGAVPIDGQVWLTATRADQPAWQGNIGWIATATALLFLVIVMERFPGLPRRLDPRVTTGSTGAGSSLGKPASIDGKQKTSPAAVHSESGSVTMDPSGLPTAQPNSSKSGSELPKVDGGTTEKILERLELISRMPGDHEPPSAPGPEKIKPSTSTAEVAPETMREPAAGTRPATATAPPTPPTAAERPVISIVGGRSYTSLEAACSEAKDGSIIELRYNGRRGQTEKPFRLQNLENIVIKSGIGFRPMIEFSPADLPMVESRMITVSGGSLQLINVDVQLNVPDLVNADRWAVFSLERYREMKLQLQLQDVTVTVVNPANKPACVVEQSVAPGQAVGKMGLLKDVSQIEPPRVELSDCLVRGQSDLILLRDSMTARFHLNDAVVGVQGSLLHAACQSEMNNSENGRISLVLESVTCLAGEGLVVAEATNPLNDYTPLINASARDSVFWCAPGRSLISMLDAQDLMEMQRRFTWTGERNQFDSIAIFWQLGGRFGLSPSRQFDYDSWASNWNTSGAGSMNGPVKWRVKQTEHRNWAKVDYATVELDAAAMTNLTNRVPGATLNKLPPAPDRSPPPPMVDDTKDSE